MHLNIVLIFQNYLLFADDARVFSVINSQNDCIKLQLNIEKLNEWSKLNELPFNTNKCQVILFSRKREPIFFNYKSGNTISNRTDSIRDSGIIFKDNPSFSQRINLTVTNAFRNLGFVNRSTKDFKNINRCFKIVKFFSRQI